MQTISDAIIGGRKPYTRSGQEECMGIYPRTCAVCGKRFEAAAEYRYKITSKGKTRFYCSYSHFRLDDKPARERAKREALNRWVSTSKGAMSPIERAKSDVRAAQKRLDSWMAREKDPGYKALPKKKKTEITRKIAEWRTKVLLAEEKLEEMEKQ